MNSTERKIKFSVPEEELKKQTEYTHLVRTVLSSRFSVIPPKAFVHTYGCQGNVADGERLKGMLIEMGYELTDQIEGADLVLYNTCAIREHAQDRVFGNVGALKAYKKENPNMIIALCGCMMQQKYVADRINNSFRYVDLVFGTHVIHRLPEFIYRCLCSGSRVFEIPDSDGNIVEGLPVSRDGSFKAWVPIMYGCNNFCSYCIVPYVRGRERSREFCDVVNECSQLVKDGYKEITLLGQNVNSYNKDLDEEYRFPALLKAINDIEGDFIIRFMTSHPRDCTKELLETMASCDKVAKHLHLPFQSGNDRVLNEMNRHYDRKKYLSLIDYAYELMPELSITSDVIVGFPGETYDEFCDTLSLIDYVKYTSLFTFIFSPRPGTKAAEMPDPISRAEKGKWFSELTSLQESIAGQRTASMKDKTYRVLVEEKSKQDGWLSGRTEGNIIIEFEGDESLIGSFCFVKVIEPKTWILKGELI
ncbi:MAG: tRNA (N6-isopentenyl adenosine(37)-C2)-methylthiotransferase MiaB [Faecalibacterium sp.]|nr:tRNA (N6-isopentenyl adenosine(37)-C2)-methylthiotransferase MiaB [Ruminococcus sp.]MCM1391612.1 tRNA (N6-isopentenyl adenosine(37)-C2)-methylthiotransferase MiaB [Ruminococcus sp.]MCM1485024.1 tRNA (N6-isopentenyl adenosine(37)-C2)-methylthiotransferase MiaB [Faecalibacterium sp.]